MSSSTQSFKSLLTTATRQLSIRRRQVHHGLPGQTDGLIRCLVEMANLRAQEKDYYRAERLYREAEMHADESFKSVPPVVRIRLKAQRGYLLDFQGQTKEAIDCYISGLNIADENDITFSETRAVIHNNLAILYKELGKWDKAEFHYKTSLIILETLDGTMGEKIGTIYNNLGTYYAGLSRFDRSIQMLKRGLRIRLMHFGKDESHPDVQQSFKNLGATYRAAGYEEKANDCFSRIPEADVIAFLNDQKNEKCSELIEPFLMAV